MNKIQIQTQTIDEQLNVLELATLTIDLWKITRPESNASIDGIENWLKNLVYDEIPVIVKAYKEERLVGWILLFIHDSKRLEINPWALGGHPHVIPEEHDKLEIAQLLLTECINFAKQRDYTRIELFYEPKESKEHYPVDPSLYPQFNLFKEYEMVHMTLNLDEHDLSTTEFPEGIEIIPLKDADEEALISCYESSFGDSEDRFFLSFTDEERKVYIRERFDKEDKLVDEASIVLVRENKLLGFACVKPTHGEGNGNLWDLGIVPEYRGQQLGSKLLKHAIDTLKKQGFKTMSLGVDTANAAAIGLYEKYSFVKGWKRVTYVWKK